jgi:N-acetylmuramoyl-L-alanine amidase
MPRSGTPILTSSAHRGPLEGSAIKKILLAALVLFFALGSYLVLNRLTAGTAWAASFSDIQGNWAAQEIARAVDAGFVQGYPDGRFKPDAGVTRAEFVAMIGTAFDIAASPPADVASFRDVRPGDWFNGSVQAAVYAGFANGYPDGTFCPQQSVTRQEAYSILARALKNDGQDAGDVSFKDAAQISSWARPFVDRLTAGGIIAGYPDGTLRPLRPISRAEAVVLINKALDSRETGTTPEPGNGNGAGNGAPVAPSRGDPGVLSVEVSHGKDGETVEIAVAQGGDLQLTEQKDPQRLVVSVPGVTVVRTPLVIPVGRGGVDKVTTSVYGIGPGTASVEISFTTPVPLLYYKNTGQSGELLITVPPQIYKIEAAKVSDFVAVNIWGTAPLGYKASTLSNPVQLVFDLPGISLSPALWSWEQQLDAVGIDSLSLYESEPQTARLAVQSSPGVTYTADNSTQGRLLLRLQQKAVPAGGKGGSMAGKRIVLDPGHGGNDPGAIGRNGTKEKNVNLAIAAKAAEILRQQGAEVIMTREGDTNPGLYDRSDIANNASADVFVSIHSNSSTKSSMAGTGTYTYAPADSELGRQRDARLHLASCLQEALVAALGLKSNGIFENRFAVVRTANMPAALVEVAFLSNSREERLLGDSNFQQQAAAAIASGITRFLTEG